MSSASLEKFAEKLETDQAWAKQFDELSAEEIIQHASKEGFDFTTDELNAAVNREDAQLSDENLEQVAAGRTARSSLSLGAFRRMSGILRASRSGSGYVKPGMTELAPGGKSYRKF